MDSRLRGNDRDGEFFKGLDSPRGHGSQWPPFAYCDSNNRTSNGIQKFNGDGNSCNIFNIKDKVSNKYCRQKKSEDTDKSVHDLHRTSLRGATDPKP
jgi:hypothetical protein